MRIESFWISWREEPSSLTRGDGLLRYRFERPEDAYRKIVPKPLGERWLFQEVYMSTIVSVNISFNSCKGFWTASTQKRQHLWLMMRRDGIFQYSAFITRRSQRSSVLSLTLLFSLMEYRLTTCFCVDEILQINYWVLLYDSVGSLLLLWQISSRCSVVSPSAREIGSMFFVFNILFDNFIFIYT